MARTRRSPLARRRRAPHHRAMIRLLDRTLGRAVRHLLFVLVRSYYALFYNVGCAGKRHLQDAGGTLILATHVSRHDGPLISALLYATQRIRPTVHWAEYHSPLQRLPLWVVAAIPMSSPKDWPEDRRRAQKARAMEVIHKVLANGNSVLLFPAGRIRRQPEEVVPPFLTGVRDILAAEPGTPVMLLRIDGLGRFQEARYDGFWSFLGRRKGRRHVEVDLRPLPDLDPTLPLDAFNARLEEALNAPI